MEKTKTTSIFPDKSKHINEMFSKIAKKYDLLNNLMTFGLHRKWKTETLKLALNEIKNPKKSIDLCSGTGDLAILLHQLNNDLEILCIDNCKEMLAIAEIKAKKLQLNKLSFLISDSCETNVESSSIDFITIGFGLRNIQEKELCLKNIYRMLKKDGVFACIDLGHPTNLLWGNLYFSYFFKIVPKLGEIFARDKNAYTYLPESLNTWYKQEELKDLILETGFKSCFFKNILGGAIAIHIAVK